MAMLRAPALVLVLALVFAGCAGEPSRRQLAITNGQDDPGHPAVNKLIFALSGGTTQDGACTATIVGRQTALTAAHCAVYNLTALIDGDGTSYDATKKTIHPKYDSKVSAYLYDIAVVRLASAPRVTPLKIATAPPVAKEPITIVGFGKTTQSASDQGVKRYAKNAIDSVEALYFEFSGSGGAEGNACYGDSGGPVLRSQSGAELVIGVMSYIQGDCGTSATIAVRTDIFTDWLKTAAEGDISILEPVREAALVEGTSPPGNDARAVATEAGQISGSTLSAGCQTNREAPAVGPLTPLALLALLLAIGRAQRFG